jgi:hypothetical protein
MGWGAKFPVNYIKAPLKILKPTASGLCAVAASKQYVIALLKSTFWLRNCMYISDGCVAMDSHALEFGMPIAQLYFAAYILI